MNRDERMTKAAELRGQGLSLRTIGAILGFGVATVHRDLARWETGQVNALLEQLSQGPPPKGVPPAGQQG